MENPNKSLSQVFRELEQSKDRQVEEYKKTQNTKKTRIAKITKIIPKFELHKHERRKIKHTKPKRAKEKIESNKIYVHRSKLYDLKLIAIALIICLALSMFSSNYIFAIDLETDEEEKVPVGTFEENADVTDIYEVISDNMSVTYQKEVLDVEEEIEFETEYIENKDLPKDEQIVDQEGAIGSQIVTYVRSYENNEISDEQIIACNVLEEPVTEIIEVGTSEVLKNYNIHIGDYLYAIGDVELKAEANIESETISTVLDKYDVQALEIIDEAWVRVNYSDEEGYIQCEYLTSETLTPGSSETCRKQKIYNSVSEDMELNKSSGLLESDFATVFSSNSKDTNNVFKENYSAFSKIETEYNINGVFVAAIAIHESNWGKSNIAVNKNNLFGYGAYDSSPYDSAVTFETYEEGIYTVALWLAKNYLNESGTELPSGDIATGKYYNGATVEGVNVKYATDTNWSTRVFEIMQDIYNSI